ncbi:hypothetical protein V7157_20610 [Neobacillus drentensis]|uniref:hypothetical protein n=1 Tax=Neobacillus drentensis TaxID=220684 RepID=UPI003001D0CB
MTQITFLASSKPFEIPDEIEEYNNRTVFEREEDVIFFSVQEVDDYWKKKIEGLFSLPYVYEVNGVGNRLFLTYIGKVSGIRRCVGNLPSTKSTRFRRIQTKVGRSS